MTSIRRREPADLAECVDLLRTVYRATGYPVQGTDEPQEFISSVDPAWIALTPDGRIVGHVAVETSSDALAVKRWCSAHPQDEASELARLFVHPEFAGRGIGSALIRAATDWAHENNTKPVLFALTRLPRVIDLYQRLRWAEFARDDAVMLHGEPWPAVFLVAPNSSKGATTLPPP